MREKLDILHPFKEGSKTSNLVAENFLIAARRLHRLTVELFKDTPYSPDDWPELWDIECDIIEPYLPEGQVLERIFPEKDFLKGQVYPPNFIPKLEVFINQFHDEVPNVLRVIEDFKSVDDRLHGITPAIRAKGKDMDARKTLQYFSGRSICRARVDLYPDYDGGRAEKARGNRSDFVTTELVLMLCIMTKLSRENCWVYLFPQKWRTNLNTEWRSTALICRRYYHQLKYYTTLESMRDDWLNIFLGYEIYLTYSAYLDSSTRFVTLISTIIQFALSKQRFWVALSEHEGSQGDKVLFKAALERILTADYTELYYIDSKQVLLNFPDEQFPDYTNTSVFKPKYENDPSYPLSKPVKKKEPAS